MRGEGLPVFCYVDEMRDYLASDDNLAILLDKARKRNIGMVLAHQRLSNITSPNVLDALSNVDIQFAGGSRTDAETLARLLNCSAEDIQSQPRGSFMAFVRGKTPGAIQLTVPQVMDEMERMTPSELREIKREMHERYCVSNEIVNPQTLDGPPPAPPTPAPRAERPRTSSPRQPSTSNADETDAKPW
jgi:hypothetical protein